MGHGCDLFPSASSRSDVGTCLPPASCSPTQGLTMAELRFRFAFFTSFQRTGKPWVREGRIAYTIGTGRDQLQSPMSGSGLIPKRGSPSKGEAKFTTLSGLWRAQREVGPEGGQAHKVCMHIDLCTGRCVCARVHMCARVCALVSPLHFLHAALWCSCGVSSHCFPTVLCEQKGPEKCPLP